jgi:hypothetical protein
MAYGTYSVNANIGGIQISDQIVREGDHPNPYEITLPVASTGTIVNRTNDTLTDVTLSGGHGLTNGTYDCFFSGGVAYGCTGNITSNVLTLNGGAGDAFPVNTTTCQVSKVTAINTAIDGDEIEIIAINLKTTNGTKTKVGHIKFMDSGNALVAEIDLVENTPRVWDIAGGATNSFTGNAITHAQAAMNDTVTAATLQIASLEDSTP